MFIELYEQEFGICNHLNAANPLSSVQLNNAEDYLKNSLYKLYLEVFLNREIHKKLGINFDDFLNRPKFEIEMIMKTLNSYDSKKNKVTDDLLKGIQKETPLPKDSIE